MLNIKLTKILCVSLITLQSIIALSFEMTEPELRESIRRYLSIHGNIDENTVDRFVEIVNRHSDLFNHLAEIKTDPEFLPYVEKYSDLKVKFTGQPIDTDIQVTFSNNSLDVTGVCDPFTRIIFINRDSWNTHEDNEKFREAILFINLGHCDLNRANISSNRASFMNTSLLPLLAVEENLDEVFEFMYQELFSIQNTRKNHCDTLALPKNECIDQHLEYFENYAFNLFGVGIPTLEYMTIGPVLR